jgi:hypothetical protein
MSEDRNSDSRTALAAKASPAKLKRKEATGTETRQFAKQFLEAKQLEYKSWLDNEVFELIDTRKIKSRNYVTGRWVLTIKRDKDGNFLKCKARWVLRILGQTEGRAADGLSHGHSPRI